MSVPTSMSIETRGRFKPSGISVEVYPSTVRGLTVELQAATANSTASSVWTSHIFGPSTGGEPLRYTLNIPNSTRTFYMRARHPAQSGFSNGPFLPTITAKPKVTPDIHPIFSMQMTYQGNVEAPSGADVFVSSSRTVKVGTQPSTATQTRFMRIPAAEFVAENSVNSWSVSGGELRSNAAGSSRHFQAPVVVPSGAILKRLRFRHYHETTADISWARLRSFNSTGGPATLGGFAGSTAAGATTGYQTVVSSTFTHTASSAFYYEIDVMLRPAAASPNARFSWTEIELAIPSYDKAL